MKTLGMNIALCIVAAMLCVAAVEIVAIAHGINGLALSSAIGAIVGLPTFAVTKLLIENKKDKENNGK
ncbi:hypothetical protein ACFLYS_01755 [Chloroflexota bacterium]